MTVVENREDTVRIARLRAEQEIWLVSVDILMTLDGYLTPEMGTAATGGRYVHTDRK